MWGKFAKFSKLLTIFNVHTCTNLFKHFKLDFTFKLPSHLKTSKRTIPLPGLYPVLYVNWKPFTNEKGYWGTHKTKLWVDSHRKNLDCLLRSFVLNRKNVQYDHMRLHFSFSLFQIPAPSIWFSPLHPYSYFLSRLILMSSFTNI